MCLAPEAIEDLDSLRATTQASIKGALETHLRHEPAKESKSRIKRLRAVSHPQYRLRVDDIRVFYDISGANVEVLARPQIGGRKMARQIRNKDRMKEVPLSEVKDDLSKYLREAAEKQIVITRHGKPAGILIGFASEEEWFDYKLDPSDLSH